jgi:transcription initiation factor TFIIIB Brf1 subunit/transcription initiation factor TFIIB
MDTYFDVFDETQTVADYTDCCHTSRCVDSNTVICTDCGVELEKIQTFEREWRYYEGESKSNPTRCVARKLEGMVILKDLENMGIGENVISIANDMYIQVTKGSIKRGKSSRKAIIAACLFHAYNKLGTPKSCDKLREIMKDAKLNKSDFLHGIKQVALNLPKSKNVHSAYIKPEDIIQEIMVLLNASDEQKQEVLALYADISTESSVFKESRPQSVAAGIVFHYICSTGTAMTIKEFSVKVNISELTINKIRIEVKRIISVK